MAQPSNEARPKRRGSPTRRVAVLASGVAVIAAVGIACGRALMPLAPAAAIVLPVAKETGSIGLDGSGRLALVAGRAPGRSVTLLDMSKNTVIRSVRVPGGIGITGAAIARQLRVAIILSDGPALCTITFIAMRDGTIVRQLAARPGCYSAMVDESHGWMYVLLAGPATSAGVPAGPGRLVAYDLRTGARGIDVRVGLAPWAEAIDTRTQRVFVANLQSNTVSVIDEHSGRVVRTVAVGPQPHAVVVDEQTGRVFVATGAGNATSANSIAMLDARTGAVLRVIPTGPHSYISALAVARPQRLVVMADGGGAVLALDAATGARRYRVRVAGVPGAIAVDERRGRLIVTGTGTPNLTRSPLVYWE